MTKIAIESNRLETILKHFIEWNFRKTHFGDRHFDKKLMCELIAESFDEAIEHDIISMTVDTGSWIKEFKDLLNGNTLQFIVLRNLQRSKNISQRDRDPDWHKVHGMAKGLEPISRLRRTDLPSAGNMDKPRNSFLGQLNGPEPYGDAQRRRNATARGLRSESPPLRGKNE